MTRVLVLGASGMLGHKLLSTLAGTMDAIGTVRGEPAAYSDTLLAGLPLMGGVDAENFSTVAAAIRQSKPDVVLNGIGVIKQLDAGKTAISCIKLNSLFPHEVAGVCADIGARFITFSTDCVFSGSQGPYSEESVPDAKDIYGRSKLLGEVTGPNCLTIRSSIVGRELRGHHSLIDWFISQRGKQAKGYAGALYTGLTTQAMARLAATLIADHPALSGLWQVASPAISKYDLLTLINDALALKIDLLRDEAFHCDRRLDGRRFVAATGIEIPSWPAMVAELAQDARNYTS